MKTKIIITLALFAVFCSTQVSCKKVKKDDTSALTKLYLPATMIVQDAITAETFHTINFTYNDDATIATITQVYPSDHINLTFNYNENGTLNTVSQNQSTVNYIYSLSYDANNKLNIISRTGTTNDMLNLNYSSATTTYMGSGGNHDGIRIKLNQNGQLDNLQDWYGTIDIDLVYDNSQSGIFAGVNLDESMTVFLNVCNGFNLDYSFFHKQQISTAAFRTNTRTFQNYVRDTNGNISTYVVNSTLSGNGSRRYTLTYIEQ